MFATDIRSPQPPLLRREKTLKVPLFKGDARGIYNLSHSFFYLILVVDISESLARFSSDAIAYRSLTQFCISAIFLRIRGLTRWQCNNERSVEFYLGVSVSFLLSA